MAEILDAIACAIAISEAGVNVSKTISSLPSAGEEMTVLRSEAQELSKVLRTLTPILANMREKLSLILLENLGAIFFACEEVLSKAQKLIQEYERSVTLETTLLPWRGKVEWNLCRKKHMELLGGSLVAYNTLLTLIIGTLEFARKQPTWVRLLFVKDPNRTSQHWPAEDEPTNQEKLQKDLSALMDRFNENQISIDNLKKLEQQYDEASAEAASSNAKPKHFYQLQGQNSVSSQISVSLSMLVQLDTKTVAQAHELEKLTKNASTKSFESAVSHILDDLTPLERSMKTIEMLLTKWIILETAESGSQRASLPRDIFKLKFQNPFRKDASKIEDAAYKLHRNIKSAGFKSGAALQWGGELAQMICDEGDYVLAEIVARLAVEGNNKLYGKDHDKTFSSYHRLAMMLTAKGEYTASEKIYREVVAGRERVFGKDCRNAFSNRHNLAGVLAFQKRYAAAEEIYRSVVADKERVLGKNDAITLNSRQSLAEVLVYRENYQEAERIFRQVIIDRMRILGTDDKKTLVSRHSLGSVLSRQRKYAAAEEVYREVVASRERVLGVDHKDTVASRSDLTKVSLARKQGKGIDEGGS